MMQKHRNALNDHRVYLLKNFKLTEEVFCALRSHKDKIITEVLEDEIKSKPKLQQRGVFLDILTKRGPTAFEAFLKVLQDTNQKDVVSKLDPSFPLKTSSNPEDLVKIRTKDENINLHIDIREQDTDTGNTVESTAPPTTNVDKNEIVKAIRKIMKRSEENTENGMLEKHSASCFSGLSQLYITKTDSSFLDGLDYSCIDCLAKDFLNNASDSEYLLSESSELSHFLKTIPEDCKALSNLLVLVAAEIENGGKLKLEDTSVPLSSVLLDILRPIKLDETITVIMLSLYGSDIDDATILNEEIKAKIQSGKLVVLSHKMSKFDNDYHNWILCLMQECLRSLAVANPEGFNIKNLLSLISEVVEISKNVTILYNENQF